MGAELATLSKDLRTLKIRSWTWSFESESTVELNERKIEEEWIKGCCFMTVVGRVNNLLLLAVLIKRESVKDMED